MAAWGGKESHWSGFEHKIVIGLGPGIKRVNRNWHEIFF